MPVTHFNFHTTFLPPPSHLWALHAPGPSQRTQIERNNIQSAIEAAFTCLAPGSSSCKVHCEGGTKSIVKRECALSVAPPTTLLSALAFVHMFFILGVGNSHCICKKEAHFELHPRISCNKFVARSLWHVTRAASILCPKQHARAEV